MSTPESEIARNKATAWQKVWRDRQRAAGLCVECTEPAYKAGRCRKHYEAHQARKRQK